MDFDRMISRGENEIESIKQDFLNGYITKEERDKAVKDIEYDLAELEREQHRQEEFDRQFPGYDW